MEKTQVQINKKFEKELEKQLKKYLEKYARWILIVEEIEKIFEKFKN